MQDDNGEVKKTDVKRPQPHGGALQNGGPGRPKGSKSFSTILREIGDARAPKEIQEKFKRFGLKNPTMRECASMAAYLRSVKLDAVGNGSFDKISNKEDPDQDPGLKITDGKFIITIETGKKPEDEL